MAKTKTAAAATDKTQIRVTKNEEKMLKLLRAYEVEPNLVVKKVLGVPLELNINQ